MTLLLHHTTLTANQVIKGRHNCIGKGVALRQIRNVVASLVTNFDVTFAPGEDGTAVWRDLKDQFNSHPGRLELIFTPRIDEK